MIWFEEISDACIRFCNLWIGSLLTSVEAPVLFGAFVLFNNDQAFVNMDSALLNYFPLIMTTMTRYLYVYVYFSFFLAANQTVKYEVMFLFLCSSLLKLTVHVDLLHFCW